MCTVSMVGDFFGDKWKDQHPNWFPTTTGGAGGTIPLPPFQVVIPEVTRDEFEALRKEVLDMKELLKRAKAYDERNGEPDCELDSKMALLRAVAKAVGVDLDDVIKPRG